MSGLSRAGLLAARPVEEVSAVVVLWFLVGSSGGRILGGNQEAVSLFDVSLLLSQFLLDDLPCLEAILSRALG